MNEETSGKEMNTEEVSPQDREAMDRRECLRAVGRWSAAAVAAATGAAWLGSAGSAQAGAWVNRRYGGGGWINGRGGWVNRAGGWLNGRGGGGGGWINRRVGGGGWINRW
ncbi:hypothetical protein DES53_11630 [Roseimicrobium gellanilyticum]|uniref:Uncharacterized protein n=1 Tax=Roseimicrobium gellanilyticum TaxID=748857 RepID=A0A366H3M2_9BACT|nr:hypothetical protein [Roseimicrobium gellanilyticum]RBP36591.1 hypothetical protein DES53_11630 [Roseimicrobium gellanilyticum]